MTLRIASGVADRIARLIGWRRDGWQKPPAAQDHDPGACAAPVEDAAPPRPRYVLAPPLLRCLGGWSVHNGASNRLIADGLSRRQAETLCMVLDLADHWRRDSQAEAVRRGEED